MSVAMRVMSLVGVAAIGVGGLAVPADADDLLPQEQKQDVLTPTLQQVADRQSTPSGADTPSDPLGDEPGSILQRANGRILVDVRLTSTSSHVLSALRDAGGHIRFVDDSMETVTVAVDPADIEALAASTPDLIAVREVLRPMTNATCPSGSFVSEGVTQLKAALARTQFPVDGSGITVGVLSDSYDRLAGADTDVSNGELPGPANPCGNTSAVGNLSEGPSGADEGRAMAQIVHDIAPKANVLFATAFAGELAFAQSIRDLAAAGADIIVDDVTYYAEPMFQD